MCRVGLGHRDTGIFPVGRNENESMEPWREAAVVYLLGTVISSAGAFVCVKAEGMGQLKNYFLGRLY